MASYEKEHVVSSLEKMLRQGYLVYKKQNPDITPENILVAITGAVIKSLFGEMNQSENMCQFTWILMAAKHPDLLGRIAEGIDKETDNNISALIEAVYNVSQELEWLVLVEK